MSLRREHFEEDVAGFWSELIRTDEADCFKKGFSVHHIRPPCWNTGCRSEPGHTVAVLPPGAFCWHIIFMLNMTSSRSGNSWPPTHLLCRGFPNTNSPGTSERQDVICCTRAAEIFINAESFDSVSSLVNPREHNATSHIQNF